MQPAAKRGQRIGVWREACEVRQGESRNRRSVGYRRGRFDRAVAAASFVGAADDTNLPGSEARRPCGDGCANMNFEDTHEGRARAVHPAADVVALDADGDQVTSSRGWPLD